MSGELTPSQFRYTTTNNRDFVIGDPTDSAGLLGNKYIVFQTSTTPGYLHNPYVGIVYNGSTTTWDFVFSNDGTTISTFAQPNLPNQFTAANSFDGVTTFNGNIISNSLATFNGHVIFNGLITFANPITFPSAPSFSTLVDFPYGITVETSAVFNTNPVINGTLNITGLTTVANINQVLSVNKTISVNKTGTTSATPGAGLLVLGDSGVNIGSILLSTTSSVSDTWSLTSYTKQPINFIGDSTYPVTFTGGSLTASRIYHYPDSPGIFLVSPAAFSGNHLLVSSSDGKYVSESSITLTSVGNLISAFTTLTASYNGSGTITSIGSYVNSVMVSAGSGFASASAFTTLTASYNGSGVITSIGSYVNGVITTAGANYASSTQFTNLVSTTGSPVSNIASYVSTALSTYVSTNVSVAQIAQVLSTSLGTQDNTISQIMNAVNGTSAQWGINYNSSNGVVSGVSLINGNTVAAYGVIYIINNPSSKIIGMPINVFPGQTGITVAVQPISDATYLWTVIGGFLDSGATSNTITFEAPRSGVVSVFCTITAPGNVINASASATVINNLNSAQTSLQTPLMFGNFSNVSPGDNMGISLYDIVGETLVPTTISGLKTANWSVTNGVIISGQGTNGINFTAGSSGVCNISCVITDGNINPTTSTFKVNCTDFEIVDSSGTVSLTPFQYTGGVLSFKGSAIDFTSASIDFTGIASFNSSVATAIGTTLGSPGSTTINGANITTGTISTSVLNANTVQTLFNEVGGAIYSSNNNHASVAFDTSPVGIYLSGQQFTTVYTEAITTAGSFVPGYQYELVSAGNTNWDDGNAYTAWIGTVGAPSSVFTAGNTGSGSGTAMHVATDCVAELGGSLNIDGFALGQLGLAKIQYTSNNAGYIYQQSCAWAGSAVTTGWNWTAPKMGRSGTPYQVLITLVGAGASGTGSQTLSSSAGGGAGAIVQMYLTVTDGTILYGTVGGGGLGNGGGAASPYGIGGTGAIEAGGSTTLCIGGTNISGYGTGLLWTANGGTANGSGGAATPNNTNIPGALGLAGSGPSSSSPVTVGTTYPIMWGGGGGGGVTGGISGNAAGWWGGAGNGGGAASPYGAGGTGTSNGSYGGIPTFNLTNFSGAFGAGGGAGTLIGGNGAPGLVRIQII